MTPPRRTAGPDRYDRADRRVSAPAPFAKVKCRKRILYRDTLGRRRWVGINDPRLNRPLSDLFRTILFQERDPADLLRELEQTIEAARVAVHAAPYFHEAWCKAHAVAAGRAIPLIEYALDVTMLLGDDEIRQHLVWALRC